MRDLVYVGSNKVEWVERPEPVLEGDLDAIVHPIAAAACDLDVKIVAGQSPFPQGISLGHECVARVERIGDAVRSVKVGDLVTVPFQISCGTCDACRRGHTGNCATVPGFSTYGFGMRGTAFGGIFAELARVPFADGMLVPIPEGVSPAAVASLSDNIPDGWRAVAPTISRNPDATVLVIGGSACCSIGLYAAASAVALGSQRVDYIDDDDGRLAIAKSVGANAHEGRPDKKVGRYALAIDASGTEGGVRAALSSLEFEGTAYSLSIFWENKTPVPLLDMYLAGATLVTGRCHARPHIPAILELIKAGRLRPELVTSKTIEWDELPLALVEGDYTKLVATRQ